MVDVTSINIIGEIDTIFNFMQDKNKINLFYYLLNIIN